MKKFAFINSLGEVAYVVNGGDYENNTIWNSMLIKEIETDLPDGEFALRYYYSDNTWKEKPEKPKGSYSWTGDHWALDLAALEEELRSIRNDALRDSDWAVLPDSPISDELKLKYISYRQTLRDLPSMYSDATSLTQIVWPVEPT